MLLTHAVRKGLRPAMPARAMHAFENSSTEMDGTTAIELRDSSTEYGTMEIQRRSEQTGRGGVRSD